MAFFCLGESGERNGPTVVEFIRSAVGASRQQARSHQGCRKGAVDDTGNAAPFVPPLCFRGKLLRFFVLAQESALARSGVRLHV